MRRHQRVVGLFILSILLTSICSAGVGAAIKSNNGIPILVSPAVLDVSLDKGHSDSRTFDVTNNSKQPIDVSIAIHSLIAGNQKLPSSYRTKLDASSWIAVDPGTFSLSPSQTVTVTAKITAPEKVEPGGHYASIIVSPRPQNVQEPTQTGVQVFGEVNVTTLVKIAGDVKPRLSALGNVAVEHVNTSEPITFAFSVKNTGNVHVFTTAVELDLLNKHKKVQKQLKAPPADLNSILLPGTTHSYRLQMPSLPSLGSYYARAIVNYGGSSDAKVLVIPSDKFYVLPIPAIIIISILVVLVIVVMARIVAQWMRKRALAHR